MPNETPWSTEYWNRRYLEGGCSGAGSRGTLAHYKVEVVNALNRDEYIYLENSRFKWQDIRF